MSKHNDMKQDWNARARSDPNYYTVTYDYGGARNYWVVAQKL